MVFCSISLLMSEVLSSVADPGAPPTLLTLKKNCWKIVCVKSWKTLHFTSLCDPHRRSCQEISPPYLKLWIHNCSSPIMMYWSFNTLAFLRLSIISCLEDKKEFLQGVPEAGCSSISFCIRLCQINKKLFNSYVL